MSVSSLKSASAGLPQFHHQKSGRSADSQSALLADVLSAAGAQQAAAFGGAAGLGAPGVRSLAVLLSAMQLQSVETDAPTTQKATAAALVYEERPVAAASSAGVDGASNFAASLSHLLTAVAAGDDVGAQSAATRLQRQLEQLFGSTTPGVGEGRSFFGNVHNLIAAALAGDSAGAATAAKAIVSDAAGASVPGASVPGAPVLGSAALRRPRAVADLPTLALPAEPASAQSSAPTPFGAALRDVLAHYREQAAPPA
jgi:hypothetical protein